MKTGYSMTIRWWRRACDGTVQFLDDKRQEILARNWRAYKAFYVTRLRVLSTTERLAAIGAALAEE
jgi:hypothetical protein